MTTDLLRQRAKALRLYGLLAHWNEIAETSWLPTLVQWEEKEHSRRSLERRLKGARLERFKAIDQFDWNWPTRCDREPISSTRSRSGALYLRKRRRNAASCASKA